MVKNSLKILRICIQNQIITKI